MHPQNVKRGTTAPEASTLRRMAARPSAAAPVYNGSRRWEVRRVFNIGPEEIILLLVVALVFLGPNRLPEVARQVGKGLREFRSLSARARQELMDNIDLDNLESDNVGSDNAGSDNVGSDEDLPDLPALPEAPAPSANGKAKKKRSKGKPAPASDAPQATEDLPAIEGSPIAPPAAGPNEGAEAALPGAAPVDPAPVASDAEPTEVSG
jgi:Tat protein translocase TatB subunit